MTKKLMLSEIIQTLSIKILQFTMRDIHTHTKKKKKKKKKKKNEERFCSLKLHNIKLHTFGIFNTNK